MPTRKKRLQRYANLDLGQLVALLPFTALQLSPGIITVAIQQVPGLYSLVEVFRWCNRLQ